MNVLLMELTMMAQRVPELFMAGLLLHWFAREAKNAATLAVSSQRKSTR